MRGAALFLPLGLGLAFVAAAMGGADDGAAGPDLEPDPDVNAGEMGEEIRAMAQALGLDGEWVAWLQASALGESGLNPLMGRGITRGAPTWAKINVAQGEATAAARAYERNRARFAACGHPAEQYSFGSGGLWAQLPANFLAQFKEPANLCRSPWSVFDPPVALAMLLSYLRWCMGRPSFKGKPTWGNLRVCMRAPGYMGRPEELERQRNGRNKLGDRLEQLGYDRRQVDAPVSQAIAFTADQALPILEGVA